MNYSDYHQSILGYPVHALYLLIMVNLFAVLLICTVASIEP